MKYILINIEDPKNPFIVREKKPSIRPLVLETPNPDFKGVDIIDWPNTIVIPLIDIMGPIKKASSYFNDAILELEAKLDEGDLRPYEEALKGLVELVYPK